MRVLVTRPEPGASQTAEKLRALGHEAVVLPLSRIVPVTPNPIPSTVGFLGALLTSTNGVKHMPVRLHRRVSELPVHVVGEKTAEAAAEHGLDVRTVAGSGAELAGLLLPELQSQDNLLYVCGRVRSPDLEQRLEAAAINVQAVEVYDSLVVSYATDYILEALSGREIDALLVYSAAAARQISGIMQNDDTRKLLLYSNIYCISKRAADALENSGSLKVKIASEPNEDAIFDLFGS
ncbi:MAG: uroporphyrinogen-III synthase [Rhizobiaceae bacterium]